MAIPPQEPRPLTPIRVAFETAVSIFFYTFISAVIATGSAWPPTIASIYGPLLVSLLAGVAAYAAARHIALPLLPRP